MHKGGRTGMVLGRGGMHDEINVPNVVCLLEHPKRISILPNGWGRGTAPLPSCHPLAALPCPGWDGSPRGCRLLPPPHLQGTHHGATPPSRLPCSPSSPGVSAGPSR